MEYLYLLSLLCRSGFSSPLSHQSQPTTRPALIPFSTRSQTLPPEKRSLSGSHTSSRPGMPPSIPNNKELRQSSMDTSGYSSSEGPNRRLIATAARGNSTVPESAQASSAAYRNRTSSAFLTGISKYRGCINQLMHLVTSCMVLVCLFMCVFMFSQKTIYMSVYLLSNHCMQFGSIPAG